MKTQTKKIVLSIFIIINLCSACSDVKFSPKDAVDSASTAVGKVSYTEVVSSGNKEVDFLIVLDDSFSMAPELKKLAARMSPFMDSLEASKIDWQMCMTTTRPVSGKWGAPLKWIAYTPASGVPNFLLKKGTAGLDVIFKKTIAELKIGETNSGDERAIKATFESFTNPQSDFCRRPGAALSIIAISDEDERSIGGDSSRLKTNETADTNFQLEYADIPENLVTHSKEIFGNDLRFTFNSIIVKPGDKSCETEQDNGGSPSHEGFLYAHLSQLTGGGIGSICDSNYGRTLHTFKDKITNSLNQLTLRCVPMRNVVEVKINGLEVSNFVVKKKILKFTESLAEGTRIDLTYECSGH